MKEDRRVKHQAINSLTSQYPTDTNHNIAKLLTQFKGTPCHLKVRIYRDFVHMAVLKAPFSLFQSHFNKAPSGTRGGLFGAGGRFKGGTDPIMEKFNESISFDQR